MPALNIMALAGSDRREAVPVVFSVMVLFWNVTIGEAMNLE